MDHSKTLIYSLPHNDYGFVRLRNGIEGTLSGLVRGQGMRKLKYRGITRGSLQIKFSAVVANISRLHRHLNELFSGDQMLAKVA
ncbi:MAG: transposase [Oligoflexia bacterium]|nr:transposase [Oligoflexia bacterium]